MLSPSPDCGGRRSSSDSVIVAINTRMITNTATPRPRRRPLSSSSGTPPARLGSITGLAASTRAASVFAFTARSKRLSGRVSLIPTAFAYERMKPRTKTWAGKLERAPASSCSIADRGTFVDAEMSPIVSARSSRARRRQLPKCSSSMESAISNVRLVDEFSLTFLDSYCLKNDRKLAVRGASCQGKNDIKALPEHQISPRDPSATRGRVPPYTPRVSGSQMYLCNWRFSRAGRRSRVIHSTTFLGSNRPCTGDRRTSVRPPSWCSRISWAAHR